MDPIRSSRPRNKTSLFSAPLALCMSVLLAATAGSAQAAEAPPKVSAEAQRQIDFLRTLKVSKTPTQAKIDSRLYMGMLKQRNDSRLAILPDFRYVQPEADGLVPVDLIFSSPVGIKAAMNLIADSGGVVNGKSRRFNTMSARVRLQDLEALAAIPSVRKVRQHMPAMTNRALNTSEGDATHDTPGARGFFGVTGAGQKVCVISDGVDSLASLQASGDLPAVDVLPGQAGSGDEGSAMLEIVHDLAPGAALGFATAVTDEASFAQNILDLAADGCTVIVDDIIYLDESPFQDGPVAQSVNTVTAAGVLYFSSAGNEGNRVDQTSGTWEGDFLASGAADPTPLAGANLHNFGDGGNSILVETGGTSTPVIMIWAEHYDLTTGTASTDFDVYDLNGTLTTIFDASTDVQDGAGGDDFPIEFIGGGAFSGERLLVDKFASGSTSSSPMFNLILFRGELADALATKGATRGHSAAVDAYSVAATPAATSFDPSSPDGPFPGLFTAANQSEIFSSDGARRVILSPTGAELTPGNRTSTGGVVRQKPDITAADGVSTAAPGFATFYGTSAAAPHAAAIAALIKQAVPAITPAQVRTALVSSAIDIEAPGVDTETGAGIIMARAAIQAAGGQPQAFLDDGVVAPTQANGDGDSAIEINESWNLTIPLTNVGGLGATAISAVLSSSTPGITIPVANSTYADLAVSASGNNATPFRFFVGPSAVCGVPINFTLTVSYSGGTSPQVFNFSLNTGAPGTTSTFTYAGAPVAIPDAADLTGTAPGAAVNADLAVSGVVGNVLDLNVSIDGATCSAAIGSTTVGIDHTFVNDLQLTLRSPTGATALIINNTDGSGNNFCQTVLDDESAGANIQTVVSANAPFTGSFKPNSALTAFDGAGANGTWQLQAQDFFSGDVGSIRAFSVSVTPAVCDAPATPILTATKTVSAGPYDPGSALTYTITLNNGGAGAQPDNAGNEFVDVLPAGLTLVSASASSGTAVATIGTNTVSWNGAIAPAATVTITINATINAGTNNQTINNQGTVNFDGDANGSNESSLVTDGPGAGATDPTPITVSAGTANVTGTKTVAGTFVETTGVVYTITLTNSGSGTQGDNPGNEFSDLLPAGLNVGAPTASSGTVSGPGVNPVTWNGTIPAGGSVTITIPAGINFGTAGLSIANQGTFSFDPTLDGTNDTNGVTDAPGGVVGDATVFVVGALQPVPVNSRWALVLLAVMLGFVAYASRRRLLNH